MPATRLTDNEVEGRAEGDAIAPTPSLSASLRSAVRLQIGLAFAAFILIGANDAGLGVLLPSVQAFYGIDKSTVSLIFLSSVMGYLLSAFGSGLLVERLGRRAYMMAGCGSLSAGALLLTLALPFPVILGGTVLMGFGIAAIDAGLNAYVAGLPNSTAKLNYLHAFFGVGALLGPLVASGVLEVGWAWNTVYAVWLVFALALLPAFGMAFGERDTQDSAVAPEEGNVLFMALRLPSVWIAAIFLCVYVGLEVSLGSWAYSFLTEERGGSPLLSGWAVSGYWLGLTVGRLVMGRLGAKLGSRQLIRLCLAGTTLGALAVWLLPFAPAEALGLWIAGFSLGPIFPTVIALMPGLVSTRLIPSAIGLLAGLGAMGAAIFPALAGALADFAGLWTLMPYEIALTAVLMGLWFLLERR